MAARQRHPLLERLDRLGLVQYGWALLFLVIIIAMTAGAYSYERQRDRPLQLSREALALTETTKKPAPPPQNNVLRSPISHAARYAAPGEPSGGFAFYNVSDQESPKSLTEKLAAKQLRLERRKGETCNFAAALSAPAGDKEPVAAYFRDRGRECCAVAGAVPQQLAAYDFAPKGGKVGPSGTAVFSEVGAGLLTLTLRFSDNIDRCSTVLSQGLNALFGQASSMGQNGAVWAKDRGMVTMSRTGKTLSVTAYYGANIERHATLATEMAASHADPATTAGPAAGQPEIPKDFAMGVLTPAPATGAPSRRPGG